MQKRTIHTKMLATLSMLSALAFLVLLVARIPVIPAVPFLKYEPKDVIIVIGGFLYGPMAVVMMSVTVSFVEMLTLSSTGFIGFVMNVISTCAFACTASFIYTRKHTIMGAVLGLILGCFITTAVMLLWNYLITPIYMGIPRASVEAILIPYILPFNMLKGALNSAITMLLYKPLKLILQKTHMMQAQAPAAYSGRKVSYGTLLVSCFVVVTCVMIILMFQNKL